MPLTLGEMIIEEEASSLLGVSTSTLSEWRMKGKLIENGHYCQENSGTIRYFKGRLQQFLIEGISPHCDHGMNPE